MNIPAIRHRSTGSDCYALDENTVVLNLTTGYDVEKVTVYSEDPFIDEVHRLREWKGVPKEMTRLYELEHTVIWTVELAPKYKRLQYWFMVEAEGERRCVFENKICPEAEKKRISIEYFKFPWINPADVIKPPAWVRDTVWYQIFPERYARSADFVNDGRFREWGDFSNPNWRDLYGGSLRGITERLPYIKSLGVSGIYLTPIFFSNSDHKYNTFDYYKVDPDFGTEDDLREMIETAHGMGIRVMLDAVFNHCGHMFFAWRDVWENGKNSKYYDWFFINSDDFARDDFSTLDGRFYTFSFWAGMPKLNTNNPEVQRYFTDLCIHWVRDFGIDGIRFDVGDEISHSFLRVVNRELKAVNPDVFLLGEIWFDSITWLNGYEYDSVMNYPFTGSVGDFWRDKKMTAKEFSQRLSFCRSLYPRQINEVVFSFLDTHDTARVRESCKNENVLLQKLAILLTTAGSPCIYYGTEIAMRGKRTPYTRSTMPWDEIEAGKYDGIKSKVSELVHLRSALDDVKRDKTEFVFDERYPRLVCYKKGNVTVYINAQNSSVELNSEGKVMFSNCYDKGKLKKDGVLIELRDEN